MNLRKIQDVKSELKGTRVLCRVDFNVKVKKSGIVMSDFRIKAALPTIELLQKAGAKVILISHIGRGKDKTLLPVANYMRQNLGIRLEFMEGIFGEGIEERVESMKNGEIVMLENLRTDDGETDNSHAFAKQLAELGEIYVNDAFAVSHRDHASITGLSKELPAFAGLLLQKEMETLSLEDKEHPILSVIGGVKFQTKAPLVEKFLDDADQVYVCGALVHDFYTAKGYEIGKSVHGTSADMIIVNHEKVFFPKDVYVENGARGVFKKADEVLNSDNIVDIGTESLEELKDLSSKAKTIIWNGPLGKVNTGTENYLEYLAGLSSEVIIGGGDTVALLEKMGLVDEFFFVSTGGGAMLEFLEKGDLVGLQNLRENKKP